MPWNDPDELQANYADAFKAADRLRKIGLPIGYPDGTLRPDEPLTGARLIFAMDKLADYMELILDATYVESRQRAALSVVHIRAGDHVGAGVLVNDTGYLITADHVVDGFGMVDVRFPGWAPQKGTEPPARVVLQRPEVDLAVCKVLWPYMETTRGFPAATLATGDDQAVPGRPVWAIGSPWGEQGRSSLGTIGNEPQRHQYYSAPQVLLSISAFVNGGNSGGGLFALDGTLLGIVVMKFNTKAGAEGMAYAVPVSCVSETLRQAGLSMHG